jgi:outer membrane protein assembly factor BamB
MMMQQCLWPKVVLLLLMAAPVAADDWPQWMGPTRDGIYRETGLIESFPEQGLPVRWRMPVAGGYAGPAVAQGRVYVSDYAVAEGQVQNNPGGRNELSGKERLHCFDAETGAVLWTHSYDCPYSVSYAIGPRATPTVADGKVYMLGTMGHLSCLDAASGSVVWAKDLKQEYQASVQIWGFSAAPLVDGDLLHCIVGGEGSVAVAFDKNTGDEKWKALSAKEPGYCPPVIIEAAGARQLLIWHAESINGLNPQTGAVYWTLPLQPDYGMAITRPQKQGDLLFAGGIGNVGALMRLASDKPGAEIVKRGGSQNFVYGANSTPLIVGETIFGFGCRGGHLRGVDLTTGDRLWETFAPINAERPTSHGTAFLTKVGEDPALDRFFLFSETGDLIDARLTREGYEERGRFHVLEPTSEAFGRPVVWSHPAYADRCAFARNDKELVCVSLAAGE